MSLNILYLGNKENLFGNHTICVKNQSRKKEGLRHSFIIEVKVKEARKTRCLIKENKETKSNTLTHLKRQVKQMSSNCFYEKTKKDHNNKYVKKTQFMTFARCSTTTASIRKHINLNAVETITRVLQKV
jgi:hypothetical protein